jgi:hypothetical protein
LRKKSDSQKNFVSQIFSPYFYPFCASIFFAVFFCPKKVSIFFSKTKKRHRSRVVLKNA